MRAIELVRRMVYDSSIAENGGLMTMQPIPDATEERMDAYCEGYFGTHDPWTGFRHAGAVYFYYYVPYEDEVEFYHLMGELPDACCYRKDEGDIVALWRIEE